MRVSVFLLCHDHIDYLVTAAYAYAGDAPGIRDRSPQELAELFYRENIATVIGRGFFQTSPGDGTYADECARYDDIPTPMRWELPLALEDVDPMELEEILEVRDECRQIFESYTYRPVDDFDLEPGQAVMVAACYQYQRERAGHDHRPESWALADVVKERAMAAVPPEELVEGTGFIERLRNRDRYSWHWVRV